MRKHTIFAWENRFDELLEFKTKYGHCRVTERYDENHPLANWCDEMRCEYSKLRNQEVSRKNSYWVERFARLIELGFEWELSSDNERGTDTTAVPKRTRPKPKKSKPSSKPTVDLWDLRYEQLGLYKRDNGDCRVSMLDAENKLLAGWVKRMRRDYKKFQRGESTSLTAERVAKLNNLGFEWKLRVVRVPNIVSWDTHVKELKEYKELNGHCRVPRRWKENQSLAIWVSNVRQQYHKLKKGENSYLTIERIAELERIGFEWQLNPPRSSIHRKEEGVLANETEEDRTLQDQRQKKKRKPRLDSDERTFKKQRKRQKQGDRTESHSRSRYNGGVENLNQALDDTVQSGPQEVKARKQLGERMYAQAQRLLDKYEGRMLIL